ncbi:DUF6197 family protein [Amnibacterium endophyticum]|uniref:Uncharacterized protein n=1 Tax=Amnibacterium endophyticum TaxID=2109337 RepID=A0ABW4LC34_9MICO
MLLDTTTTPTSSPAAAPARLGWRQRLAERRRLQRVDRVGAKLARLDAVSRLLARAETRLEAGWTQDAWFVTRDDGVLRHHVGTLHADQGVRSEAVCLVAAIAVEAMPGSITGPDAQRAIGALWNVLHGGSAAADWATAPGVTAARAYDLVRWNDASDRRQSDVLALVQASRASMDRASAALRADLARA